MTTPIPPAGYPSDSSRTQSDMQTYFETMLSICKEQIGGTGEASSVQLSSHAFTPGNNNCVCIIDTSGMSSSDTLDTITPTNIRDGEVIFVRITDDARVITVANGAGGTGQIFTKDGDNIILNDTRIFLALKYNEGITAFEELFCTVPDWASPGAIGSTTPNTGAFTTLTVTGDVPANQWLGNNTGISAPPAFNSLTLGDMPSGVVTGIGFDLSPLFTATISGNSLVFGQYSASNGTIFGNFSETSSDPILNPPGDPNQVLGVTVDGLGLEYKDIDAGANVYVYDNPGSIEIGIFNCVNQCRLYAVSGSPYADSGGSTSTLYYGPTEAGNLLTLSWQSGSVVLQTYTVSEQSQDMTGLLTADTLYYVTAYLDPMSGNVLLDSPSNWPAWSGNTPPTVAVGSDNRIYLDGDFTRLIVGVIYTPDGSTVESDPGMRGIWNMFNRKQLALGCADTTSSWTYNSTTPEIANGQSDTSYGTAVIGVVQGIQGEAVNLTNFNVVSGSDVQNIGIGNGSDSVFSVQGQSLGGSAQQTISVSYSVSQAIGFNYYTRLESINSATTCTFYGNGLSGMSGTGWF